MDLITCKCEKNCQSVCSNLNLTITISIIYILFGPGLFGLTIKKLSCEGNKIFHLTENVISLEKYLKLIY